MNNTNAVSTIASEVKQRRLVSLDALRGFDMFWIIGARALAAGLVGLKLPGVSALAAQLSHSAWNGFTFYDLIFPLFIFITGVSLVLSVEKRMQRGDDRASIMWHVVKRAACLFLLGIIYNGVSIHEPLLNSIRVMGVLQRSALCYLAAATLVLYTKPRTQIIAAVGILAGYWAAMKLIPVPGVGAGVLTVQGNLAHYVDNLVLPGRLYFGTWDPEGLLSTVPAIATCLLGVFAGRWLKVSKWNGRVLEGKNRALYLFLAGLALVGLGVLVNPFFPINKKIWTSSFVLLTGGLSGMLLAAFHWIVDVRGRKGWAFPFVVVGANSIFIYLAARFIPFGQIAHWIVGGDIFAVLDRGQVLFAALAQLTLEGSLLLWLYNRKTFIRI